MREAIAKSLQAQTQHQFKYCGLISATLPYLQAISLDRTRGMVGNEGIVGIATRRPNQRVEKGSE
jgi:hypothetical protein